ENEKGESTTRPLTSPIDVEPYAPPLLLGEGRRVQSDWLYEFLKKPTTIRPQVPVRMPTFHFTDAQASTLAQWFIRWEEMRYQGEFTRRFRQANALDRVTLADKAKIGRSPEEAQEILERLESRSQTTGDAFARVQDEAAKVGYSWSMP